jgi:predicted aspartyl protease
MGNAIRIDDHIYGCSGDFSATLLSAVNVMTGAIAWQVRFPKASLLYADGRVLILDETGQLSLATLSPEGMKIHCKANVLEPTAWTVPTLVGGTLYLRDRKTVKALDLTSSQPGSDASEKPKDYRFRSGQSALNIPFEEDDGHIRLRLRLNGSEPCWFGLDTGAIRSVVDKRKAQRLGLRLEGSQRVGGAGGTAEAGIIKHLALQLPGAELLDQTAWALPLDFQSAAKGRELAGILGYELFSHFVVEIDYASQRMHLYEPRTYEYRGPGESVPISLRDGEVYVKAKVVAPGREPVEGQFVIDTGSANTLMLAKAFIEKHALRKSVSKTIPVRGGGVGGPIHMAMGRLAKLQLGSFALESPITGFVDVGEIAEPDEAGNIGGRFLRRFRVIFDYSRKRMILERGKYFSEPEEFDMSGAGLVAEGETFQQIRVVGVREKSPAADAGLRPQDLILKIDDQRADILTLSKIKQLFRRDGREYSLIVKRGEQELRITLRLRRMI